MIRIKFIGKSDRNFENGKVYTLIKIRDKEDKYDFFHTWISNNNKKIVYIPYSNIDTFNENWEVVE